MSIETCVVCEARTHRSAHLPRLGRTWVHDNCQDSLEEALAAISWPERPRKARPEPKVRVPVPTPVVTETKVVILDDQSRAMANRLAGVLALAMKAGDKDLIEEVRKANPTTVTMAEVEALRALAREAINKAVEAKVEASAQALKAQEERDLQAKFAELNARRAKAKAGSVDHSWLDEARGGPRSAFGVVK